LPEHNRGEEFFATDIKADEIQIRNARFEFELNSSAFESDFYLWRKIFLHLATNPYNAAG
jgi:hypothetical protein